MLTTSRQTAMSRQMQRSLEQLQMGTLELSQEISRALAANPLLESEGLGVDALDWTEELRAEPEVADMTNLQDQERRTREPIEWGSPKSAQRSDGDPLEWMANVADASNLRDHLVRQVAETAMSHEDRVLVCALIDSLDESGYLAEPLSELGAAFGLGDDAQSRLQVALRMLQSMDPAGVGARDLRECLDLQLRRLPSDAPGLALARLIVADHLEHLGGQHRRNLPASLGVTSDEIDEALALIRRLDAKPGVGFDDSPVHYVLPDLELVRSDGRWMVRATRTLMPRLHINETYAAAIADDNQADRGGLREKLREARWLIRSVEQRASTIELVGAAIVERQAGFFDHGDIGLKPLTLAEIAQAVGVHESTVSRVVNNKYLATPTGLVSLRRFFGSSVSTTAGRACSAAAVKAMILQMVERESPQEPMTDHELTAQLARKGVRIARRTVSKYRGAIGVEPYEMRRIASRGRVTNGDGSGTPLAHG
ncbi:MAG: RNA polymerase factor sigma-54 [Burkholderiaceae bacterium]